MAYLLNIKQAGKIIKRRVYPTLEAAEKAYEKHLSTLDNAYSKSSTSATFTTVDDVHLPKKKNSNTNNPKTQKTNEPTS